MYSLRWGSQRSFARNIMVNMVRSKNSTLSEAFVDIVRNRKSVRIFDPNRCIDHNLVRKLLELSVLSPSSLNLQPYRIVVVSSPEARKALADNAMLGGNTQRVKDAPYTAVFLADKDPAELTRKLISLELDAGTDPSFLRNLPATVTSLLGPGFLARRIRRAFSHLASPISPNPVISKDLESWAVKSASLAAMTFMLGASANGLSTSAMEGFDERRVCYLLQAPPERFTVSLIISLGYSLENNNISSCDISTTSTMVTVDSGTPSTSVDVAGASASSKISTAVNEVPPKTRRYPLDEICYGDTYGHPLR